MAGLNSAAGFIRKEIGESIRLRYDPEIKFELDETLDEQMRIDSPTRQASTCTDALKRETDTLGMDSQARHGLEVLSVLPPDWREEISDLGEGQTFDRMGKAWFYLPPHDQEDCLWEAAVKDGILHVEFEVGPESA